MIDLNSIPGVAETWPDFTPSEWGAEHVSKAVYEFVSAANLPGVRSVFEAKPVQWDNPQNFYGSGQPWGVSLYVFAKKQQQTQTYSATGTPERVIVHDVAIQGLYRASTNDEGASVLLQRRIEDGLKDLIIANPKLGGTVYEAGISSLVADRGEAERKAQNHEIWFYVSFPVKVWAPPGA